MRGGGGGVIVVRGKEGSEGLYRAHFDMRE